MVKWMKGAAAAGCGFGELMDDVVAGKMFCGSDVGLDVTVEMPRMWWFGRDGENQG